MIIKKWYKSRTIWGGVASTVAGIGAIVGIDLDQGALTEQFMQTVAALGGLVAVFGRFRADSKIG